jgi:hypothetical protein
MSSGNMYLVAVVAGIIEFVVVGILFLMVCFSLAGYAIYSRHYQYQDPATQAQLVLGVGAFVGFIYGLAGSVSALERRRWVLSITGALTTAFWGILLWFYTILVVTHPADAYVGITIGSTVILLSVISGILLIISRREFQKHIP